LILIFGFFFKNNASILHQEQPAVVQVTYQEMDVEVAPPGRADEWFPRPHSWQAGNNTEPNGAYLLVRGWGEPKKAVVGSPNPAVAEIGMPSSWI
jgi:hypothetical protein